MILHNTKMKMKSMVSVVVQLAKYLEKFDNIPTGPYSEQQRLYNSVCCKGYNLDSPKNIKHTQGIDK